jgi:hypothetical protein
MSVAGAHAMRSNAHRPKWAPIGLGAFVILGVLVDMSNPLALLAFVPYSVVGSLLVVRRPRNLIGWLLVVMAIEFSLVGRGFEVTAALYGTPWEPWLAVFGWIGTMAAIGMFACLGLLTATFPTGRLPTGGIGRATRAGLALSIPVAVAQAFDPEFMTQLPDGTSIVLHNPIGLFPDWGGWSLLDGPLYMVVLGGIAICVIGLVMRFRTSGPVERQQDKWFLGSLAAIVVAVTFGFVSVALVDHEGTWGWIPAVFAFALPPIAIGIAITRYRLYDIDRIISRTIAYASITLVLFAVFAGVSLTFRSVVDPVVGGGPVAVAASTLAVAALFTPLRSRIQRIVDRRFNRSRADAELTVDRFAARLRDQLDLDAIGLQLTDAAVVSVEPASATVWLRHAAPPGLRPSLP